MLFVYGGWSPGEGESNFRKELPPVEREKTHESGKKKGKENWIPAVQ